MTLQFNPWVARFDGLLDREVIRSRATVKARPVQNVNSLPIDSAQKAINEALESVHHVSEQELDLLVRLVGRAAAHCRDAYPDLATFCKRVNDEEIRLQLPEPICITGLAGGGKSSLLEALGRVMPPDQVVELGSPFRTPFEMNAYTRVVVKAKSTITRVMYPFLPADSRPRKVKSKDGSEILVEPKLPLDYMLELASRSSYINGRAMNALDEMQFLTQSTSSNTKVAQVLMIASYLNAPLVYSANYSLCHRLLKRPHEERDRLLSDVVVLLPEMPGSDGFNGLLREYQVVLDEVLDFSLENESNSIYNMSVGIKRCLKRVLVLSYIEMRNTRSKKITMDHVRVAYKSKGFAVMRADITTILEQAFSGKMLRGKSDFWCPFGVEYNQMKSTLDTVKKVKGMATVTNLMTSALSASERRALVFARQVASESNRSQDSSSKVIKMHPRTKQNLDAATLLVNTVSHKRCADEPAKNLPGQ